MKIFFTIFILSYTRLLVQITTPIEFLVFEEIPDHKNYSSFIMNALILHLYKAKETFLDSTATRAVIDYVKRLLKDVNSVNRFKVVISSEHLFHSVHFFFGIWVYSRNP
jgi:ABC-type multidrug transport system fused ATPase/permease subunit